VVALSDVLQRNAVRHDVAGLEHAVLHVLGLSLMNRWAGGENPFADADWSQSWHTTAVSEAEWERLRAGLRDEARRWLAVLGIPREVAGIELSGMIGSIAHLAYHLGAIRQIDRTTRGPAAND
jgi:hypothetical protein